MQMEKKYQNVSSLRDEHVKIRGKKNLRKKSHFSTSVSQNISWEGFLAKRTRKKGPQLEKKGWVSNAEVCSTPSSKNFGLRNPTKKFEIFDDEHFPPLPRTGSGAELGKLSA